MVTQWAVNGYFHYGSFSSGPRALLNTMSILEAKCEQHVSRAEAATVQSSVYVDTGCIKLSTVGHPCFGSGQSPVQYMTRK